MFVYDTIEITIPVFSTHSLNVHSPTFLLLSLSFFAHTFFFSVSRIFPFQDAERLKSKHQQHAYIHTICILVYTVHNTHI